MSRRRLVFLSVLGGLLVGAVAATAAVLVIAQRTTTFTTDETVLFRPIPPTASTVPDWRRGPGAMDLISEPHRWLVLDPTSLGEPSDTGAYDQNGQLVWSISIDESDRIQTRAFADGLSPKSGFSHLAGPAEVLKRLIEADGCLHVGVAAARHNVHHGEVLFAVSEPECIAGSAEVVALRMVIGGDQISRLSSLNAKLDAFAMSRS